MKRSILAPLCSAFVLPGLGQIINRQIIKGVLLAAGITVLFVAILVKVMLDLSVVMGEIMGSDLALEGDKLPLLLTGMRARNMTMLYILICLGAAVWAFSVFDAYLVGRRYQTQANEEDL